MPTRPCWVEINAQSLEDNYRFLKSLAAPAVELLAVVKSDAYGHSLEACAPAAVRAGARWLGVTSVEEGIATRALCPEAHVLIMSGCYPGEGASVAEHRLTAVVWESWHLDELEAAARNAGLSSLPVHLEIDTGMSRQGVDLEDLPAILARLAASPLRLEAVLTHLYAADETDGLATEAQMSRLDEALRQIAAAGLAVPAGQTGSAGQTGPARGAARGPEWLNVGSSAALLNGASASISELAARWSMKAMLRPGLALYGVAPRFEPDEPAAVAKARLHLKPVLSWKTRVVSVRTIPTGAVVGYNGTFVATEPMRLALLAVGYADGLDRRLSNRFCLLVRGQRAPLVGRVSMDLAVLDVTDIEGVAAGDEVVILGSQGDDAISSFEHAEATGTIPWEVFTRIGARVRRVIL
jgi:alanine racemase